MQNSEILDTYQNFKGNSDQLTLAAGKLAESLSLALEPSEGEAEGNERLLRYYVSLNVVDKPDRQGRDAVYNFRHLLQDLTACPTAPGADFHVPRPIAGMMSPLASLNPAFACMMKMILRNYV